MADATARRRSRRARLREDRGSGPEQIAWRQVTNPHPPMTPLSEEQIEDVHDKSMEILEDHGIEVVSETARDLYRAVGGIVDDETGIVRVGREAVMEVIGRAPSTFTLTPRNPDHALEFGRNCVNFGMASGAPNVHDRINGRRAGNFEDYKKLVSLGQHFNVVDFFGNQTLAPIEMPPNNRHLDTYRANLELTDKVFSAVSIGSGRTRDAVEMVALARGLTLEEMVESPSVFTNINVNSPRKLDVEMADGAMQMAALGQATIVTPFTLMGAMTPVTLAAAFAQQNAEALFGLMLPQMIRPGAPVVYGGFTSNVDLRSGAPAFGTPENAKANLVGGQLARRYDLPYRTSACNASNCVDAQAVYETQMALWSAVMGHGNVIYHAAGWLEGGLIASFEKFIIDVEMLQAMEEILKPIDLSKPEFGMDAIADVDPGGHFFGTAHTLERYQSAFYEPLVSDWQNHENWEAAGAKDATERATAIWQDILENFEPPALDESRLEAIDAFIEKRRPEIGEEDPVSPIELV
ncbi:MAG: trimethylamine methyltransferase family protein [Pseudomonadota bacterium]